MTNLLAGWKLWQKLVFGLGLGIIVTIFLGCVKFSYTRWQRHKLKVLATQESQCQREPTNPGESFIPVRVRAIEQKVGLDGVGVSRSNTSRTSSIAKQKPRQDFDRDLEKQPISNTSNNSFPTSTTHSAKAKDLSPSSGVQQKQVPTRTLKDGDSKEVQRSRLTRSRHPPLSYKRYTSSPYIPRPASASGTLEGLDAIHRACSSIRGRQRGDGNGDNDSSPTSSNSVGDDDEPISASAPHLFPNQHRPKPDRQSSSDLDLLNSHRMSQAAETGQLTPRIRKSGKSNSIDLPGPSSASVDRSDYFGTQELKRRDSESSPSLLNSSTIPKRDPPSSAVRRHTLSNVQPFAPISPTTPISPLPSPPKKAKIEMSIDDGQATAGASERSPNDDSGPPSPLMLTSPGIAALTLPPPSATSLVRSATEPTFERCNAEILRGHGTGFEILRPGSLKPAPPSNDHRDRKIMRLSRDPARSRETSKELKRISAPALALRRSSGAKKRRVSVPPLSLWKSNGSTGENRRSSRTPSEERNKLKKKKRRRTRSSSVGSRESRESRGSTGSWSSTF